MREIAPGYRTQLAHRHLRYDKEYRLRTDGNWDRVALKVRFAAREKTLFASLSGRIFVPFLRHQSAHCSHCARNALRGINNLR